jgi:hypothetical protein
MAHFAELDDSNVVLRVIVLNNNVILDENGNELEELGIAFCKSLYGNDTNWKQTSYNNSFRKNYAAVGFTWREDLDGFVPPQNYTSWTLNETTCRYEPPISMPNDGNQYMWDEENTEWTLVNN